MSLPTERFAEPFPSPIPSHNNAPYTESEAAAAMPSAGKLAGACYLAALGYVLVLGLRSDQAGLVVATLLLCTAIPIVSSVFLLIEIFGRGHGLTRDMVRLALVTTGVPFTYPWPLGLVAMIGGSGPVRHHRRQERPTAVNFWNALSESEKDALMSVGTQRRFPRGATLIHEGDQGDYVVVIRSGWTKVCVYENGHERVLAERGPGQLVGERAALQVNPRSATVIALDKVDALVLHTPDFADFISAHPRVLEIVESQVYHRLTEDSAACVHIGRQADHQEKWTDAQPGTEEPDSRWAWLDGQHCTIVMTDIVGFGANNRTEDDRHHILAEFPRLLERAFVRARVPWDECHIADRGDGVRIIVPPTISTAMVMAALDELAGELKRYNRRATPAVQIKLRAAVNVGPVVTESTRLIGEAIIIAARLLDARVLRQNMAETGALLGVMASTFVYESVIRHLDVAGYRKVRCTVKESRLTAWMQLNGPALPPSDMS